MAILVSVLGVLIALIGVAGLAQPRHLAGIVKYWQSTTRFWIAVVVRFGLGVALLVVAPTCRFPALVTAIGVVSLVAAVGVLILGRVRMDLLIAWWLTRPPAVIRLSALVALAFGVLLVWAGA